MGINLWFYKKVLIFLVLNSFFSYLFGQTPNQINQAKQLIKEQNLSQKEVKSIARSQGFSEEQINKVIENELKSQEVSSEKEIFPNVDNLEQINESSKPSSIDENRIENYVDESKNEEIVDFETKVQNPFSINALKYFGYDIFNQDPKSFQATSVGVVDPNYLIGPGDEIIILLWGETQFRQLLKVDREGFIFIPEVGQIFVNGLNLNLLESKLFKVLSQSYSSLSPSSQKATTFLDVSLGNLRPLRVQILGQVSQPGSYTVSPSTTLFSSLYYCKGPKYGFGSLRDIQLIRNGEKIISIDFYDYLLTGKKPNDVKLQLDDVIFIPSREKTISLIGEINNPGIYELKSDEMLEDLIEIAGGLKITAYLDRAQIDRIMPFKERKATGMDRLFIDIDLNEYIGTKLKFELKDGDKIQIFSVLNSRQNVVQVNGAVVRPGSYDIGDSLTLKNLIKKTGLLGDAFLDRIDIIRINEDLTKELIKVDYNSIVKDSIINDIQLKNLDLIKVFSKSEMIPNTSVTIKGNIKRPGRYRLINNMTLYDLLCLAGGFNDPEFLKTTYLKRAELVRSIPNNKKKIIPFSIEVILNKQGIALSLLEPNDLIRIYSKDEIEGSKRFVHIDGYVKRPGKYELFEDNMTIVDLLFKAGGLDDPGHKANTFLQRADLIRYDENFVQQEILSFSLLDLFEYPDKNFKLMPEDRITIYKQSTFKNKANVSVYGLVKEPGKYQYIQNMTIEDLIVQSGGIKDERVLNFTLEIARKSQNDKFGSDLILLDLINIYSIYFDEQNFKTKLDENHKRLNALLMPNDFISLRKRNINRSEKYVEISGEVMYPGVYSIKHKGEKILSIIQRSGGLLYNANPKAVVFLRDGNEIKVNIEKVIKKSKSKENFILQHKDYIVINEYSGVIEILGEINSPGYYSYKKGSRIKDVIRDSGGYTKNADHDNIYIQYVDGRSLQYGFLKNFKVEDGAKIIVGEDNSEPLNKTQYLTDLTRILANITEAVTLIFIAKN